jgi:two-component system chemotaxis response regulator CheB
MIKVLVVDDSAVVRRVLSQELSTCADIDVVATAVDPFVARDKIVKLKPDVVTLDLELPRMGGLAFLARLMKYHPLPVIVVSGLTPEGGEMAVRALELGAVDVVAKPGSGESVAQIASRLVEKIRVAAKARPRAAATPVSPSGERPAQAAEPERRPRVAIAHPGRRVVAIGASTGGTEAIKQVLMALPDNAPGVVIVQHMPRGFTASFADRLDQLCLIRVQEARDGDGVEPGLALVAPGGRHMVLRRRGPRYSVVVKDGPPVHHQRPSVDVLFHSVARQAGADAVGVLLTGMGRDGAQGLRAMHEAGATTFAQDEASCVVFGMPREAVKLDAADAVVPLDEIPHCMLDALDRRGTLCAAKAD